MLEKASFCNDMSSVAETNNTFSGKEQNTGIIAAIL